MDGPLGARGEAKKSCGAVAVVRPACWYGRCRWPRWVPRSAPNGTVTLAAATLQGCTNRRTDRLPLSPAPAANERSGGGRPRLVGQLARHHGPHDTGRLDGQSHRRELARLAAQQVEQPRRGGWPTRLGVLDDRGCLQHQQLPQPLVASPADAAQALSVGSSGVSARDLKNPEGREQEGCPEGRAD